MMERATSGFTLIELVVAITLIGICSATLLGFMATMDSRNAASLLNEQSISIADAYLQEALSKSFTPQPGPRNDIADYNPPNFPDIGARDSRGTSIAGLDRYTIQVDAVPVDFGAITQLSQQCYRVTVTVTDPFGGSVSVVGYRTLH